MERKKTCYPCHIWEMEDLTNVFQELKVGWCKEYGDCVQLEDGTELHLNYVWDDGNRYLIRCKDCGGLILVQCSEYHSFTDDPDGYYEDWLAVSSVEEADLLNILLGAWELDNCNIRHVLENDGKFHWREGPEPRPHDPEELKAKIREKYAALKPKQKKLLEKLMDKAGKDAGE